MDLSRSQAAIAHDPLAIGWGQRGQISVPYRTGPDGKNRCRWCDSELTGRRTSWCGQGCVDAHWIRSNWGVLRVYVLRRDKHTCQICSDRGHEVDHIQAVVEGGTDDPANLRLLCVPCHKQATAELARRRRHQRRSIGLPLGAN